MTKKDDTVFDASVLDQVAESLDFEPTGQPLQDKMFANILHRIEDTPPAGTITIKADAGDWWPLTDKIDVKALHNDQISGLTTSLWRLQPGAELPSHLHKVDEECLVLEGEFFIGGHRLRAGDFHLANKGCSHPHSSSPTGGLLMIRTRYESAPLASR